jgi:V/A-type H+/Na+-transporting ATPase subunit D
MANIIDGVKPTRMELLKLQKRVVLAVKGHKLLKEKRDALITEFLAIARSVRSVRVETMDQLGRAYATFLAAQAVMGIGAIKEISLNTCQDMQFTMRSRMIMGVAVPVLEIGKVKRSVIERGYGFVDTSALLDETCELMEQALSQIIKLAEMEEAIRLLAFEVQKTKRKVNSLEYILIPKLKTTVKYIHMRLDEIELESFTRLKKIKGILEAKAREHVPHNIR